MFRDELGISGGEYQKRAQACVLSYLHCFSPSSKSYELKTTDPNKIPVSIRIHGNPPSVQIEQAPVGGRSAGLMRIKEKMHADEPLETIGEFIVPKTKILIAEENDLTRECIILTLQDGAIETILSNELMAPEQVAETLEKIRCGHPNFFVVVQRYIIGIERNSGLKVPYSIVEESDKKTFDYLEELPGLLV